MALRFCRDTQDAEWITHSPLPWHRLVTLGPGGFAAYLRLRLIPDPSYAGQSENDLGIDVEWRVGQVPRLFEILARYTATPDDCYFCVWEGWPREPRSAVADPWSRAAAGALEPQGETVTAEREPGGAPAVPGLAPRSDPDCDDATAPQMVVPHRAYWLYRGPLADRGRWNEAIGWTGSRWHGDPPAAFAWPADRAWCVTQDVDPHWIGIGVSQAAADDLLADSELDVVAADPTEQPPSYQ